MDTFVREAGIWPLSPYSRKSRNADFDLFAGAGPLQLHDMASPCSSLCNWTDTNVNDFVFRRVVSSVIVRGAVKLCS